MKKSERSHGYDTKVMPWQEKPRHGVLSEAAKSLLLTLSCAPGMRTDIPTLQTYHQHLSQDDIRALLEELIRHELVRKCEGVEYAKIENPEPPVRFWKLSYAAQGLYFHLLHNPDSQFEDILKASSSGSYQCRKLIKELKEKGFLSTTKPTPPQKRMPGHRSYNLIH